MFKEIFEESKNSQRKEFESSYIDNFNKAFDTLTTKNNDHHFLLQSPSAYIFSTNGLLWGIDIQLYTLAHIDGIYEKVKDRLSKLKYIFITHEHIDHLDIKMLKALADTDIKWIIPDFISKEKLLSTGIKENNLIFVTEGAEYTFDSLNVKVFRSEHFRPNGNGVDEYGYFIDTGKSKLLFPGDIRWYRTDRIPQYNCDCLFSNVWLGQDSLDFDLVESYINDFCDFTTYFNPSKVFFGHLCVPNRKTEETWTYIHAGFIKDAILAKKPSCKVSDLTLGEIYSVV